jgi:hypothetical protein
MKTRRFKGSVHLFALLSISIVLGFFLWGKNSSSTLFQTDTEALSGCEIYSGGGNLVFYCRGTEGECVAKKLGYTLVCDGEQIIPDPNEE